MSSGSEDPPNTGSGSEGAGSKDRNEEGGISEERIVEKLYAKLANASGASGSSSESGTWGYLLWFWCCA